MGVNKGGNDRGAMTGRAVPPRPRHPQDRVPNEPTSYATVATSSWTDPWDSMIQWTCRTPATAMARVVEEVCTATVWYLVVPGAADPVVGGASIVAATDDDNDPTTPRRPSPRYPNTYKPAAFYLRLAEDEQRRRDLCRGLFNPWSLNGSTARRVQARAEKKKKGRKTRNLVDFVAWI